MEQFGWAAETSTRKIELESFQSYIASEKYKGQKNCLKYDVFILCIIVYCRAVKRK